MPARSIKPSQPAPPAQSVLLPQNTMPAAQRAGLVSVVQSARSRQAVLRAGLAVAAPLLAGGLAACGDAVSAFAPFRRPAPPAAPRRQPLAGPLTYVALGASDAVGEGIPNGLRDGWVPQLARQLPQPARLVNLGVGASTLRQALDRQLPRAIQAQPHLVTVWLVVNDVLGGVALDEYKQDLNTLLSQLKAQTTAVVAVGNAPYPASFLDPWGIPEIVRRTLAGGWNRVIADAAKTHDAVLVDLYAGWKLQDHPEYIGPDGLHPSASGYRALADTFLQTLKSHHVV